MNSHEREIARCDREIAEARRLLLDGHPDIQGLCMALGDWIAERELIEREIEES